MNRERTLVVIICAILLGVIFLLTLERDAWKHKAIIANENYEAELLNSKRLTNGQTRTLQLTQDQFKEREESYLDSLNKLSDEKIKLSNVLRLTKFELSKKQQTRVEWRDSLIAGDTIRIGRCVSVMIAAFLLMYSNPKEAIQHMLIYNLTSKQVLSYTRAREASKQSYSDLIYSAMESVSHQLRWIPIVIMHPS
jgi:hypothetical protein